MKFGELKDLEDTKGIYGGFIWLCVLDLVWRGEKSNSLIHLLMISTLFEKRLHFFPLDVIGKKMWSVLASISSRYVFWQALFQRLASSNPCVEIIFLYL